MRAPRLALAVLAAGCLCAPAAAQPDFSVQYRAAPGSAARDGDSATLQPPADAGDDVLTVQTAFSDVPLLVPAALREPLEEALGLYAQAGDWSSPPALSDADRRRITARMEALLAGPLPGLHPVAMSLGNGLVALGNASGALHWFTACARAAAAAGDWVTAGIATMNVGFAHAADDDPRRALELLLRGALPLLQRGRPEHTAFWLGNTVAEAADVLSRMPPPGPSATAASAAASTGEGGTASAPAGGAGGDVAAAALLDEWIPRLGDRPFHRLRLLRGNLAWQSKDAAADKAAAWEHWLAGADEAAAAGDTVWRDRLLLTAYATAAVAGFVGRPAGAPGAAAIRAHMAPEAIVEAGRARGLEPARALAGCLRLQTAAGGSAATAAACDVPALAAAAVPSLPWLVLAVTTSRRSALWADWLDLEDAAVAVEAACIAALLRGAQALIASGDVRHLALPPPLAACATSEPVKVYALPYEHIGFGAGTAPFPPALLLGVGGIFTGTLTSPGDQQAAVVALGAGSGTTAAAVPGGSGAPLQRLVRRLRHRRARALTAHHRLHVGLLSYDLRAHASAWLAEGYVRHFNRSRVALAAFHYGPVDSGSALAPVAGTGGAVGWRRVAVPPPPTTAAGGAGAASGTSGNAAPDGGPRPHALVAQLAANATMSDRIAAAADAAYVASSPSTPAEVLCAQMLSRHGPVGGAQSQLFPLHVIDEHMGHTFGSRYGLAGPCRIDDDSDGSGAGGAAMPPHAGVRHRHRGHPLVVSFMFPGSTAAAGVNLIVADTVIAPPEEAVAPLVTAAAGGGGELHGPLPQAALTLLQLLFPTASNGGDGGGFLPMRTDTTTASARASSLLLPLVAHTRRHVLGQAFSERLLLLPHAYTAHFYSCAAPVFGGRDTNDDPSSGIGAVAETVQTEPQHHGHGALMSHACDLARPPLASQPAGGGWCWRL